jgi:O-antigen/teichoic acid export membrane protein
VEKGLIRNIGITGIALVFLGLAKLIFNITIGRVFGSYTLGVLTIAMSTAFFFVTVTGFFQSATPKYIAEYLGRGDLDAAKTMFRIGFFFTLCLSILVTVITVILSEWISSKIGIDRDVFLLAIPLISLYTFYLTYRRLYYGVNNVRQYLSVEIISDIIFLACLGVVVFYIKSLLLLPFILSYILFFILSTYLFRSYFGLSANADRKIIAKRAVSYSSLDLVGNIASIGIMNLSVVLTGLYVSKEWIGYYAAAYSIILLLSFVPKMIDPVLFSSQSYLFGKNRHDQINETLNIFTKFLITSVSLMGGLGILLSVYILRILFGVSYIVATPLLQLLFISMILYLDGGPINSTFYGTKYMHLSMVWGIISFVVCVSSWLILIPEYGVVGTAIGLCLGYLSSLMFGMYYAHKYFDLDVKSNVKIFLLLV